MVDILKRAVIPVFAFLLSVASVLLAMLFEVAWLWLLLATLPVLFLGAYDYFQRKWVITRNYPVAGRIRWLFYQLRPYLRAYIVEDDLNGSPFRSRRVT